MRLGRDVLTGGDVEDEETGTSSHGLHGSDGGVNDGHESTNQGWDNGPADGAHACYPQTKVQKIRLSIHQFTNCKRPTASTNANGQKYEKEKINENEKDEKKMVNVNSVFSLMSSLFAPFYKSFHEYFGRQKEYY